VLELVSLDIFGEIKGEMKEGATGEEETNLSQITDSCPSRA